MPCYFPLKAWRKEGGGITFRPRQAFIDQHIVVPCGKCIGCRLRYSRDWAIRCWHESLLWDSNKYLTLTYDEENIPKDRSVNVRDMQLFFKRLRKKFGEGVRYFHCGEYGNETNRPHYHAIIFNIDFSDLVYFKNVREHKYYISETLNRIWNKGFVVVSDVTFESAAYCARYITKKVYGDKAEEHYQGRAPEYTTMSRGGSNKKGLGYDWYQLNKKKIYYYDEIVIDGRRFKPPRYYDQLYKAEFPDEWRKVQVNREFENMRRLHDYTDRRLETRERVKRSQIKSLKRGDP